MEEPKQVHYITTKRILKYIKGSVNDGLYYTSLEDPRLVGYTDNDYGGDPKERKGTSGYMFKLSRILIVIKEATDCSALIMWQNT